MNLDEKRTEVLDELQAQAQSNSETRPEAMRYGVASIDGLQGGGAVITRHDPSASIGTLDEVVKGSVDTCTGESPEFLIENISVNGFGGFSFSNTCDYRLNELFTVISEPIDGAQELESVSSRPIEVPAAVVKSRADESMAPNTPKGDPTAIERAFDVLVAIKKYGLIVKRLILEFHRNLP